MFLPGFGAIGVCGTGGHRRCPAWKQSRRHFHPHRSEAGRRSLHGFGNGDARTGRSGHADGPGGVPASDLVLAGGGEREHRRRLRSAGEPRADNVHCAFFRLSFDCYLPFGRMAVPSDFPLGSAGREPRRAWCTGGRRWRRTERGGPSVRFPAQSARLRRPAGKGAVPGGPVRRPPARER